jgi:hypothetical protein
MMKRLTLILNIFLMAILLMNTANAALFFNNNSLNITEHKDENIYAITNEFFLNADTTEDLNLISNNIKTNSIIEGDLNIITSSLNANHPIKGDARIIGTNILINTEIGGETLILGNKINLTNNSILNKDVNVASGRTVYINGKIIQDIKVSANKVVINGEIYGDAEIIANELVFGDSGLIKGNLKIPEDLEVDKNKIDGTISKIEPPKSKNNLGIAILYFLMYVVFGIVLLSLVFNIINKTDKKIKFSFFKSILAGLVFLILTPFVVLGLAMTIIGIPLAILLLMFYFLLIFAAPIFLSYRIGMFILNSFNSYNKFIALILGLVIYYLLSTLIPSITFLFVVVGAGGFCLMLFNKKRIKKKTRKKKKRKPKKRKK